MRIFARRARLGNPFIWLALVALGLSSAQAAPPPAREFKVGLVLDKGGRDDRSFNAAAFRGATKAKDDLPHVTVKTVEAADDNASEPLLRALAQKDFDLIIAVGVSQADPIRKVAAKFADKHFAIVDAEVAAPNVRSLLFDEHEGSYLVGAIAGFKTKTGKLGFIGGMDIPLIRRFEEGFRAGAKKANPKVDIITNYIGLTPDSWNNPAKAKELAISQYNNGADIIFAAAGASNAGLFDAAEEKKHFAIGVDSNQNGVKPGLILTSMLKRVDTAVFSAIKDGVEGKFTPGPDRFGLRNQGIDFALDQYNEKLLPPDLLRKVEMLKLQIIDGKLKVPDYYQRGAGRPKS